MKRLAIRFVLWFLSQSEMVLEPRRDEFIPEGLWKLVSEIAEHVIDCAHSEFFRGLCLDVVVKISGGSVDVGCGQGDKETVGPFG